MNLENKKHSDHEADGSLAKFESYLDDYWLKAREHETKTLESLEKHLWLANGAAATVAIGYIQANEQVCGYQYYGAWLFVLGVLTLVFQKYLSTVIGGRDLARFIDARTKFYANEETDFIFSEVRDNLHSIMNSTYRVLSYCSGLLFMGGCALTLIGVR